VVLTDWDANFPNPVDTVDEPWFAGAGIGPDSPLRTAAGATAGDRLGTLRGIYGQRLFVSDVRDEAVELYWFAVDGDNSPINRTGRIRGWLFWSVTAEEAAPEGGPTDEWLARGLVSGVSCSSP